MFSVLSVVKLSLEIGEIIWVLDYKSKVEKKMELCPPGGQIPDREYLQRKGIYGFFS